MKRICTFTVFAFLAVWLFLPVPMPGEIGDFNPITGLCWCADEETCLHEGAHKMDKALSWISHSREFQDAVHDYLLTKMLDRDPLVQNLNFRMFQRTFSLKQSEELYADMFMWMGGKKENSHFLFWKFYDWENTARYVDSCWKYEVRNAED